MMTKIEKMLKTVGTCLFVIALTGTAYADEPGMKIDYRNLDLNRADDVAQLYERIQKAAKQVCSDASASWDSHKIASYKRCVEAAVTLAVRDVNNLTLTALHEGFGEDVASR